MAINVSFNGATIFKPGAYSRTNIDLEGGFPIGPAGLIAVIGEADAGKPGAQEINIANNRFGGDQLIEIRDKYRGGPIVDSAAFLFAPGADAAIPSGAQTVWFYKTNNSVQASLALANSYGTVEALEYGVGGNRMTYKSVLVGETPASHAGGTFDETAVTAGQTWDLYVDGVKNTFTVPGGGFIDNATLAVEMANAANWSAGLPVGVTITVGGVDTASSIDISMDALATANQLGYGRSLELVEGGGTALDDMGMEAALYGAAVEPSVTLTVNQKRDLVVEEDSLGGNIVLEMGRDESGGITSASVSVTDTQIILKENGVAVHTLLKESFAIMGDLIEELQLAVYAGWSAELSDQLYSQLSLDVLDEVADVGAMSGGGEKPARLKKDAYDVATFFALSSLASISSQSATGLPDALTETPLAGGDRGSTSPVDIINALEKFQKFHVNSILPLFSRDAGDDIADGLTDSGSTYTIAGIHQAVKTHLSLMKTTKKRSERQGYLSYKSSYDAAKTQASVLADARLQMVIQDIRQTDSQGTIKWFQPWGMAALVCGARAGAPIGEPLTFKFLNCSGIRHTGQPMSTAEEDIVIDFDPDLQADDAIQSGITFMEAPQTGGFRVVVDNTTYGRDNNWVFNRGNVLYAADIVAFNFRNALENRFVGRKNTVSATDVVSYAAGVLNTFLSQGITVSTADAPQGYKQLTARIEGNTIRVSCVIKLVEGIDFVLADITVQRATSEA
jgi:hypothetical protein